MTQEYKPFSPEGLRLHNEKLQAGMEEQDIDMLMLPTPENICYSTGYRSRYTSSLLRPIHVLVSKKGDPAIILRILEKTMVQYTSWASRIYCWGTISRNPGSPEGEEPISIIDRIIREIQPDTGTIGLEVGDGMQYFWSMELLKKIMDSQPDIRFTGGSLAIQRTRMVKTSWEIERVRHVCRITEQAILETGRTIVVGEATEKDISKGIAMRVTQGRVDRISYLTATSSIDKYCVFNTYVTDRVVQKGEYALVDTSGHIDGYVSNLTRVFYLGTVPQEEQGTVTTASGCVATAKEATKPGVPIAEINRIYGGCIRGSRFGEFLFHFSGHCIGLNVVEYPTIHDEVNEKLKSSMVFAVENGVYLYDLEKGVESTCLSFRTGDEVLVTEDSAEWITGPGEPVTEAGVNH